MPERIAIVGAGLSGLSAAYELCRAGVAFEVFEASRRTGGYLKTSRRDGFLIENGADSWLAQKPWVEELARDLGMEDEVVASPPISPSTLVLRGGKLVPMPKGMRLFVPSDLRAIDESELFSEETKRRFHEELAHPPPVAEREESVAEFAERHFGREVVDLLAGPLLAGVYGGDAARLSAEAVIPGLVAMEREHRSLIRGAQAAETRGAEGIFRTLRGGMQSLTDALTDAVGQHRLHLGTHVLRVITKSSGYSLISTRGAVDGDFDAVILAMQVPRAAEVLGISLPAMDYSSAATVALAFAGELELPRGFGFLTAARERCAVMAATFVHQKWQFRVPEGKSLLRGFVNDPRLLSAPDGALLLAVEEAFREVLGVRQEPLFGVVDRWPNSMPQYAVGHTERVRRIREQVAQCGRVLLAGNSFEGVGMPDAVRSGREAGRATLAALGNNKGR